MQDRYVGDIGDYVKMSLIQSISIDLQLGIAWYPFQDEIHNSDGRHTSYLNSPDVWRSLNPSVFDCLKRIVAKERNISALERLFPPDTIFTNEPLPVGRINGLDRSDARAAWFERVHHQLQNADVVFMDPDNGLTDDTPERRKAKDFGKKIPLSEVRALCEGRTGIVYHHNSRFKGGHDAEVDYWLGKLGMPAITVRANAYSCRTFFIINPTPKILTRAQEFCKRWRNNKVRLYPHKQ